MSPKPLKASNLVQRKEQQNIKSVEEGEWGISTTYSVNSQTELKADQVKIKSETQVKLMPSVIVSTHSGLTHGRSSSVVQSTTELDNKEEESHSKLRFLLSSMFATILEDAITQFRMLVECNSALRIMKTEADMPLLRALKYGVQQPAVTDELAKINVRKLNCLEYKLNKLEADRNLFGDLLTKMYVELSKDKSYQELIKHVKTVTEYHGRAAVLHEDEARNKTLSRELHKQMRQQRNQIKSTIYDANNVIEALKRQVEDACLMAETKGRYVDNWQNSRSEQHVSTIFNKESVYTNSIEYYKNRTDHEQRVHSEAETLTNIVITETLKKVEQWMDKYEKDMEDIDLKIFVKRSEYENMKEKRIGLEDLIEKHGKEMADWVKFKDEREAALQYHNSMTKSAIIVQAWWRGLLVRKQLGPYRPKKPPKKAPKK